MMNSVCRCQLGKAFQLANVSVSRRSFFKLATSAHFSTLNAPIYQSEGNLARSCTRTATNQLQDKPNVQTSRYLSSVENTQVGDDGTIAATPTGTLSGKIIKMFGWLSGVNNKSSVLWRSAMTVYRSCVEDIDYDDFFEACDMPDTFQSWFMVIQLHVWMCLVRLKAEGKDGQFMYRKLVEVMWQDVESRMKKLGDMDSRIAKESLQELVQEFYGLIFAYDEGLLSDDRVLAAALWRNLFYDKHNTNASELANLVEYVRRQIQHLDNLDSGELLTTGHVSWLPLKKEKDQEPFLYNSSRAN